MTGAVEREIERLRDDPVFRVEVAQRAGRFGPRTTEREAARCRLIDDSSYFTSLEVAQLVERGRLRDAAVLWGGLRLADALPAAGELNATARCWHAASLAVPGTRYTPCRSCRRAWRRRELLLFIHGVEVAAGRRLPHLLPGNYDSRFR